MFLVIEVLSFIPPAVCPGIHSESMHVVVLPFARVTPAVRPRIGTLSNRKPKETLLFHQSYYLSSLLETYWRLPMCTCRTHLSSPCCTSLRTLNHLPMFQLLAHATNRRASPHRT
jgi:hypothetical protein